MTRRIYISFFLTFIVLHAIAGVNPDNHIEKNSLLWKSLKVYNPQEREVSEIAYFDNCLLTENGKTPVYSKKIAVHGSFNPPYRYKFLQLYFEPVPQNELHLYKNILGIKDSIEVIFNASIEQKQNFLAFTFLPVRKNPMTGNLERIKYFVLEIDNPSLFSIAANTKKRLYPAESVLNTGEWFKFTVAKSGIYQISYTELKTLGLTNPDNVRIYGNGGLMLPEINTGNETTDLKEIPIQFYKGTDGIFNDGDYIVFYAQGPATWKWNATQLTFEHEKNKYTDVIPYFLTSGAGGKTILAAETPTEEPTIEVSSYDYLNFHEADSVNLIRSGREFYGEKFNIQNSYDFSFDLPYLVSSENITIESQVLARSQNYTSFQLFNGSIAIGSTTIPSVNVYNDLTNYANVRKFNAVFSATPGKLTVKLQYNKNGDESAEGWLDFIRIKARQHLLYNNAQFEFRDIQSVGAENITQYSISSTNSQLLIWDITDINETKQVVTSYQSNTLSFKATSNVLKSYIIFDPKTGLLKPQFSSEKITNQNLHSHHHVDFVIVTHPNFFSQANKLAEIHATNDGLNVSVVTTEEVYNEFSSGNPDPAAIRNYLKLLYDNAGNPEDAPKYLLLFGDGSYDRKTKAATNSNFVMTYQSENSLSPVSSYVSDDYFGLLDDNEQIQTGSLDIGIGRFPASNTNEADTLLHKVRQYISLQNFGSWRNQICFIGDDEDNNIHMQQADQLADMLNANYPDFNTNKIYLDAYQQVSTSSGERYPDVNSAIYDQLNSGTLIMNYTGHGNERGLAHEQVIRQNEDINQWKNKILPLFVTATCEFSRFDDYSYQTAGEDVLLNPNGGGIALLTTTRLVYSGPNFVINQQFYNYAFTKDSNGEPLTFGEILRRTKNNSGDDINKLNFTLLGDPALKLAVPKYLISTDSINHKETALADTVKAYQTVEICGHIENNGAVISDFNGVVGVTLFDKSKKITCLGNDDNTPFSFDLQNNILYKGKATVLNGYFKVTFIVPRDIDYNFGAGKISYYASNSAFDASGNFSSLVIGGLSEINIIDNSGPLINLFLNLGTPARLRYFPDCCCVRGTQRCIHWFGLRQVHLQGSCANGQFAFDRHAGRRLGRIDAGSGAP